MNKYLRTFSLIIITASSTLASASTLYQWKDANGVLTFSPTPPPEGSTLSYKTINTQGSISQSEAQEKTPVTTNKQKINIVPAQASLNNAEIEKIRKDRYCLKMNQKIAALETRVTHANSTAEINKTILQIEKYQRSVRTTCNQ